MRPRPALPLMLAAIVLFLGGCKSEPEKPAKPTATIENLKVAHAVAFRRAEYYAAAAKEAEAERLGNLAALYHAISRSEQIHAAGHEAMLASVHELTDTSRSPSLPVGTVPQSLKMSISLEATETTGLYPAMAQAATAEKWPEAAEQMNLFRQADERHAELLANAQSRKGVLSIATYCVCGHCGYIQVDQTDAKDCPVCSQNTWERL